MPRRRPLHAKPFVGAAFALVTTHAIGIGGLVSTQLEGRDLSLGWLFWIAVGLVLAIALFWLDLGVLRLCGETRPERYRRAWRALWIAAPLIGIAGGVALAIAVTT